MYLDGQPLAKIDSTGTYYYHNDHLGTPQKMTDSAGVVQWSADYKPFGEVNITTNNITNNLRFPGQYYDAETGNHYNYKRDYNPIIGRFTESDPIGIAGGKNHLYAYTRNNPIRFIDPLGLKAGDVCNGITMKRRNIHLSGDDKYGHWWVEIGGESYGWWPKYPVDTTDTLLGVDGELNGQTSFGGTATRDPHHGDSAEDTFNPKLTSDCKTCDDAVKCIKKFAKSYGGSWSWPWGQNCHSFQTSMMSSCNLTK